MKTLEEKRLAARQRYAAMTPEQRQARLAAMRKLSHDRYHAEGGREAATAYFANRRRTDPEFRARSKATDRRWYEKNKEKVLAKQRRYYQRNHIEIEARRKAVKEKKRAASFLARLEALR